MASLGRRIRLIAVLSLGRRIRLIAVLSLGGACALLPAATEAATEVVTGVISCTSMAPRTATLNGSNGVLDGELVCSSRPASGDCTDRIRDDLADRGCAFRRDTTNDDEILYFACSGPRRAMIALIDLVCRRLNGF